MKIKFKDSYFAIAWPFYLICSVLAKCHTEENHHWICMATFYDNIAQTHREEICDLIAKNPHWKTA